MQKIICILGHLLIFGLLTLFTQTGGLVWLIHLPIFYWWNKRIKSILSRILIKTVSFSIIYLFVNFFVVPPFAKLQSGRVPLPVFGDSSLKPHQVFYFAILNHHYVRPEVKASCELAAKELAMKFPGSYIYYLDANFPFFDGYPLQPHFTHRYGTTVDIALHWSDSSGEPIDGAPIPLAYGASAPPMPGEVDMEGKCGNWYRSLEMRVASHFYEESNYNLDIARTTEMIRLFANDKSVRKILLEPHLKARLGLGNYDKIRFQGCRAARHDDHIHVIW